MCQLVWIFFLKQNRPKIENNGANYFLNYPSYGGGGYGGREKLNRM